MKHLGTVALAASVSLIVIVLIASAVHGQEDCNRYAFLCTIHSTKELATANSHGEIKPRALKDTLRKSDRFVIGRHVTINNVREPLNIPNEPVKVKVVLYAPPLEPDPIVQVDEGKLPNLHIAENEVPIIPKVRIHDKPVNHRIVLIALSFFCALMALVSLILYLHKRELKHVKASFGSFFGPRRSRYFGNDQRSTRNGKSRRDDGSGQKHVELPASAIGIRGEDEPGTGRGRYRPALEPVASRHGVHTALGAWARTIRIAEASSAADEFEGRARIARSRRSHT